MPLKDALLLDREQITEKVVATYIDCGGYKGRGVQSYKNQGQGFLLEKQVRNIWCNLCQEARRGEMTRVQCIECRRRDAIEGRVSEQERRKILCLEYKTENKKPWWNWKVVAHSVERKAQQSGIQAETPKSVAKTEDRQRDIRKMFKILREVWLNIRVEKVDIHERVIVKVLLDSGITEMFMDKKLAAKHGFKLQKLDRPVTVRNMDGINNSRGAITYQVEINVYYKSHMERMRIDICNLGRTNIILDMLQLQVHNPKINWETGEVKITRYPLICRSKIVVKEEIEKKKKIGKRIRVADQIDGEEWKWTIEEKFNNKVILDREKVRKIVPQKFHRQLKVFKKAESERMPVRKPWDHAINLREDFMPRKERMYLMSKGEKEEVRESIEEQLRKGYI